MKPIDAIKQTLVKQGFSQPVKDYEENYLMLAQRWDIFYESDELEGYWYGGERRKRSTDPIWSVDVYKIKDRYIQKHQLTLYYLDGGPKRSFVFEELQPIQDLQLLHDCRSHTCSSSFCFEWAFSWGTCLAYSIWLCQVSAEDSKTICFPGNRFIISFYMQIVTYSRKIYFVKISFNYLFSSFTLHKQEPLTPWIFPPWQQLESLFLTGLLKVKHED